MRQLRLRDSHLVAQGHNDKGDRKRKIKEAACRSWRKKKGKRDLKVDSIWIFPLYSVFQVNFFLKMPWAAVNVINPDSSFLHLPSQQAIPHLPLPPTLPGRGGRFYMSWTSRKQISTLRLVSKYELCPFLVRIWHPSPYTVYTFRLSLNDSDT